MDVYNSFPVQLVVLAAVSPAWYWAGRLTARCKLPLITGFMLAGVASGPTGLGLITSAGLGSLRLVDHVCLSLIALAAGAELQMAELRKIKRQVCGLYSSKLALKAACGAGATCVPLLHWAALPCRCCTPGRAALCCGPMQ